MMLTTLCKQSLILSAIVMLAASSLTAQQDPAVAGAFEERLDVHLVEIDFLATDRRGRPITDLTPDELIVKEDGRPQEIALFGRHRPSAASHGPLPDARIYFEGPDGQRPRSTRGAAPRWFVFLFDLVNGDLATRRDARDAADRFIESRLAPGDQVALATFNGTVHLEQNFTGDRGILDRALDRAFSRPAQAVDWQTRMRELILLLRDCQEQMIAQQRFEPGRECVASVGRNYVQEVRALSDGYLRSFETLGRLLGGVVGRKFLFHFSHGVSLDPGWEAAEAIAAIAGSNVHIQELRYELTGETDYRRDLAAAIERAVRSDVTIFTLDGSPQPTEDFGAGERVRLRQTASPYAAAWNEARRGLTELARSTGGKFFGSGDFLVNLDRALESVEGAYTLGYYRDLSRVKKRDAFTKVKVACRRKGVEISSRPGYYLGSPSQKAILGRLQLAGLEARESDTLVPFSVTAFPLSFGLIELEREVGIQLTLHLELRTREGATVADSFHFLGHTFPRETWEKGAVVAPRYAGHLLLPPGDYRFSAVLRDPRSDTYAELEELISVPGERAAELGSR